MSLNKTSIGLLASVGAALLWAVSGVFGKVLMIGTLTPSRLVFYRSTLGTAILFTILLFRDKRLLKIGLTDLPFFIAMGVFGLAFTQFAYYSAIQFLNVGFAILLQYLAPLWILMYERFFLKMPLTLSKVLALILALLGCSMISLQTPGNGRFGGLGLAVGILSGVCFASYGLMSQRALKTHQDMTILFYSMLFTALFWGITGANSWMPPSQIEGYKIWMILYVAAFGTIIPYSLFILALKHLEASRVGIITTLEPVVAAAIAWIYLGEHLTTLQILGGMSVLTAIVILQVAPSRVQET